MWEWGVCRKTMFSLVCNMIVGSSLLPLSPGSPVLYQLTLFFSPALLFSFSYRHLVIVQVPDARLIFFSEKVLQTLYLKLTWFSLELRRHPPYYSLRVSTPDCHSSDRTDRLQDPEIDWFEKYRWGSADMRLRSTMKLRSSRKTWNYISCGLKKPRMVTYHSLQGSESCCTLTTCQILCDSSVVFKRLGSGIDDLETWLHLHALNHIFACTVSHCMQIL